MPALSNRCLRHADRPAVARCPSCSQPFCRECVVEHEFRLLCADCLRDLVDERERQSAGSWVMRIPIAGTIQLAAGVIVLWMLFYLVAAIIRRIPSEVHEGLIWTP